MRYFDAHYILKTAPLDKELRESILIYLLCSSRPLAELLAPRHKDIRQEFARHFAGMTEQPIPLARLLQTRERLITEVTRHKPKEHRKFPLSFEAGKPNWELLSFPSAQRLPAVRWRLENLNRAPEQKRKALPQNLKQVLYGNDTPG